MAPSLVQSASNTGTGSSVTVTLGAGTAAGNCLVVAVGSVEGTTNPTVSGITLGGAAGNFAAAKSQNNNADTNAEIWTDQNCAGGQTSVVVSFTGGTGTGTGLAVWVMEWSGVLPVSAVDAVNGQNGSGGSFSSLASGTLAQASEVVIGVVSAATTSITITPPGAPWTELGTLSPTATFKMAAGWQVVSATTTQTYSGTLSGTSPVYGAAIVTLLATVPATSAAQISPGPVWSRLFKPQMRRRIPPLPGVPPPGYAVNQWAGTFTQPASFGTTPPALESVAVALTPASSVGGGSGVPTAGNWLICITGMNEQSASAGFTVGVGDDIHSFWRPGDETTSTWAVSTSSALTRTSIWYTPNLAAAPGYVYVAPSGCFDALAVLIVEISAGPWDVVTGINTNYSAAATTLNLALGAPSATSFAIAAVCGDDTTAGQAFGPGGWTSLHTVQATDGSDHLCDAVLTSAILPSTSGSVSVNGTTSSAVNLSGVLIEFQTSAPSPVPAANNPAWPYMKFEAAFGGGFQTPQDQLTWTDLTSRLWSWNETTGIQYQLGQIQATELDLELDNFDGYLSSDNTSSPYSPNVVTGVPLRLRAAIGTIGGQAVNRWYVISRNAEEWPQQIDPTYRRRATATGTDIWSVLSASAPTPYRGEVTQDAPYAWWPLDDQPGTAGVLPTSMRNAAPGNSNALNIVPSPSGIGLTTSYFTNGTSTGSPFFASTGTSMALYEVGASSGWMFGDPASSPQTSASATGNPVTPNPGSAAWQQVQLYGNTGSDGWFLSCNDASFPPLSAGVTVEGWFYYPFFGSPQGAYATGPPTGFPAQQPVCPFTLLELATGSNPVAILQLDTSGHLSLVTYNGATPTSHSIWTTTDLRDNAWFHVAVGLTTTTWTVWINGGATATVSGSAAGMTSAWTWLIVNGDLGANGGSSAGTGLVHGANVSISHLAVYPSFLPAWRVLAHYVAATTGFGLLPTPTGLTLQTGGENTPDGQYFAGTGITGGLSPGAQYGPYTGSPTPPPYEMSVVVCATAPGGVTSAPSAWTAQAGPSNTSGSQTSYSFFFASWTGLAPSYAVYNGTQIDSDNQADLTIANSSLMTDHYGSSTVSQGIGHTGTGSGASPPASASSLGDTVQQRIERILGYGNATYPGRCIDPASLPVQAATDIGGQQTGQNVTAIQQSDSGFLAVDNLGSLIYFQKSHLAAQAAAPAWTITPTAPPTVGAAAAAAPYYPDSFNWLSDPQRVFNAILITPFSPDGSSLANITPSQASQVKASQSQYGPQPQAFTSHLQSQTEMQSQADWIFSNYGQARIRVEGVRVDAAPDPALFPLVLGINVGDVVTCQNWQIGGGGITGTFRVSNIRRRIAFGGDDPEDGPVAEVVLQLDYEPSSYWG